MQRVTEATETPGFQITAYFENPSVDGFGGWEWPVEWPEQARACSIMAVIAVALKSPRARDMS